MLLRAFASCVAGLSGSMVGSFFCSRSRSDLTPSGLTIQRRSASRMMTRRRLFFGIIGHFGVNDRLSCLAMVLHMMLMSNWVKGFFDLVVCLLRRMSLARTYSAPRRM